MGNNLRQGKPLFTGIAKDPNQELQDLLDQAQALLDSARKSKQDVDNARQKAAAQEQIAQSQLQTALGLAAAKGPLYAQLFGLPDAADAVKKAIAAADSIDVKAAEAAAEKAKASAENAETTVCGYANRVGNAGGDRKVEERVRQTYQRRRGGYSGGTAACELAPVCGRSIENRDCSTGGIQGRMKELTGASDIATILTAGKTSIADALSAALTAKEKADEFRKSAAGPTATLRETLGKLDELLPQIEKLEAAIGNSWAVPLTPMLRAQRQNLEPGSQGSGLFDLSSLLNTAKLVIDPVLKNLAALEKTLAGIDVDKLLADGESARRKLDTSAMQSLAKAEAALAAPAAAARG